MLIEIAICLLCLCVAGLGFVCISLNESLSETRSRLNVLWERYEEMREEVDHMLKAWEK